MCGRPSPGRGNIPCCIGGKSLVKRNDNAARAPLVLVGRTGPFQVSQSQLERIWPGGIRRAQQLGNRVLYARDITGRSDPSRSEREACYLALDWVKSRAISSPQLTGSGYAQTSIFDDRAENLRRAFSSADQYLIHIARQALEEFFESLDKLFGGYGVGRDVSHEVMDMGLDATTLVSSYPDSVYSIMKLVWRMMGYESSVISRMLRAVPHGRWQGLQNHASDEISNNGSSKFPVKLLSIMTGYHERSIENLVLANVI